MLARCVRGTIFDPQPTRVDSARSISAHVESVKPLTRPTTELGPAPLYQMDALPRNCPSSRVKPRADSASAHAGLFGGSTSMCVMAPPPLRSRFRCEPSRCFWPPSPPPLASAALTPPTPAPMTLPSAATSVAPRSSSWLSRNRFNRSSYSGKRACRCSTGASRSCV